MFDHDLAAMYQVSTKVFNQAVRRNLDRFPEDFMFQLEEKEAVNLRSQSVTSRWGGRRYAPYVFTEQGVAMLSSVLKSKRAIQVNIAIMRAFVRLREVLATHKDVVQKLVNMERVQRTHGSHIETIWKHIEELMAPPKPRKKYWIGFKSATEEPVNGGAGRK
jgi:phage regulator Rha-like protein